MEIIYVISTLYLFTTFILLKKSEEKINFLKFFTISIVSFLCYNSFICFIMSTLRIPITLATLSIINVSLGSIFSFFIIKNKEIQKYNYKLRNLIAVVIILIVSILLFILNFGIEFEIKYMSTDAAVHYAAARDFYKNDKLLDKVEDTIVSKQFMTTAYINTGILFKVTAPIVGEINLYKIFILCDIFSIFLIGVLIYCAVEKVIKSYVNFIITMVMIIFFTIGYPFNSLICGYVYLQLGVIIIATIINILQYFNEGFNIKYNCILLLLCNYALFFTYCIFVPVVYVAEFIYIIIKFYKITKKIFLIKNLLAIFIIFVIPLICGIYYYVIPYFTSIKGEEAFIFIEGYIYRNCWSNFILILPLALVCLKKKKEDTYIWSIFTSTLIIFMGVFFILVNKFNLSTYYYYKYNYVLWFILWYGAMYTINITEKKLNYALIIYVIIYIILASISIIYKNVDVTKEKYVENESIIEAFDIYGINKTIINNAGIDYINQEIDLIKYIYNNLQINKENKILIIASPKQESWFSAIFNYRNREDPQLVIPISEIYKWNNKEYKYLFVLYNNNTYYPIYKNIIKYGEVLIENSEGAVYVNN